MKKIIYLIIIALLGSTSFAQKKISDLHSGKNLDCSVCHECKTPTKSKPCLVKCPRIDVTITTYHINDAPDLFLINNIKDELDIYSPVKFQHKNHAEMAELDDGCATCHHHSTSGKIEKCSSCHEPDRKKRTNLDIPDLKAAYHRQCMDCHSGWEKESNCETCHTVNKKYKSNKTKESIVKTYKPIVRINSKIYETNYEKGKLVTFHHNEHIDLFGFQCVDCHKNESCQSCHNQKPNFEKNINSENHNRCKTCHNTEKKSECIKCHSNKEKKAFNHFINTGFNINKYHSKNSCNSCHKEKGKYRGLQSACQNCHNWNEDNFNHAITGLQLNDDHSDLECSDCHENNNYAKPTCTNCHEEEEGFVVPKKLPGKRIK